MRKLDGGACVALCLAALAASTTCGAAPAGAATATGQATPARTPAVKVKNVTPNDGAVRVGVRDPIKIVFNGALDPASVTRAHVAVYSFGQPMPPPFPTTRTCSGSSSSPSGWRTA
jgi:hypothetical protein